MSQDTSLPTAFSDAVLLVCRQCRKRGNGPKDMKSKDVVRELKKEARLDKPRPRVLLSSCLGLCPRRAIAIARIGVHVGPPRIAALASVGQAAKLLPLLSSATSSSAPRSPDGRTG